MHADHGFCLVLELHVAKAEEGRREAEEVELQFLVCVDPDSGVQLGLL